MILIVDANAVVPNPELRSNAWKDITAAINEGMLSVVVPRIVAAEITNTVWKNRWNERPRGDMRYAPEALKEAQRKTIDEVRRWADQYDAAVHLEAAGAVIRDSPKVSHDVVAQRAIHRQKPFNDEGGGYRDALHWYTVLELAAEHPDEEIVFVSNDRAYRTRNNEFHKNLLDEIGTILTTGTIRICPTLKEFVPPAKFAGDEERTELDQPHLKQLVAALFPNGKLHAPELWAALNLDEPVDADVSAPGEPKLVWSFARKLVDGGKWYRTRLRLTARVVLDWIDWTNDDEEIGSEQELDITAWYSLDEDGFHLDEERTDLQPAPVYTPPRVRTSDVDEAITDSQKLARALTDSAFANWKAMEFGVGSPMIAAAMETAKWASEATSNANENWQSTAKLVSDLAKVNAGSMAAALAAQHVADAARLVDFRKVIGPSLSALAAIQMVARSTEIADLVGGSYPQSALAAAAAAAESAPHTADKDDDSDVNVAADEVERSHGRESETEDATTTDDGPGEDETDLPKQ